MPKLKQPNYFKVRSIGYCMNMLLSLPRQSPKGNSFGKFCNCLVRSYKNYGGITSPQCKASKRLVSWSWK